MCTGQPFFHGCPPCQVTLLSCLDHCRQSSDLSFCFYNRFHYNLSTIYSLHSKPERFLLKQSSQQVILLLSIPSGSPLHSESVITQTVYHSHKEKHKLLPVHLTHFLFPLPTTQLYFSNTGPLHSLSPLPETLFHQVFMWLCQICHLFREMHPDGVLLAPQHHSASPLSQLSPR